MAQYPTTSFGGDLLDQLSGHTTALAIYTAPPTEAGGGTEVQRVLFSLGSSTGASAGRTAQRTSTAGVLFVSVPVASTSILGLAIVDDVTDEILVVDDAWTPTSSFSAGGNMLVDALTVFTEK